MQIFAGKKFEKPIKIIEAFDNESFIEAFSKIEKLRKRFYLLGYIRYESKDVFFGKKIKSKYPLLYFEVFDKAGEFCKQNSPEQIKLYSKALIDYKTYSKSINRIKEEIACGNTYEVNYTYDYKIETELGGFELYKNILPRQTTPYNAYIKNKYEEILSFSPELFFELNGNKILTKPMKGTIKRGGNEIEDKANVEFLRNDIKNRAENVMIVDLLRNDLGKIAKTGTVKVEKLFDIETHKTVHQMTSEISAELDDNITLYEIFKAIFPCGSITGAPKINTMDIIDNVEFGKREVYCGAIGLITPQKTVFSVPIRILQKHNDKKNFLCRVGGAIVWDSIPKEEWEETLTKIKFLGVNGINRGINVGVNVGGKGLSSSKNAKRNIEKKAFQLVETILVKNGKMKYKTLHFNRMKKSAKELGFQFNNEIYNIKPEDDGMLRVLLSLSGDFETQYLPLTISKTNKIAISKTQINSNEPMLYHKTTYRPWYKESMRKIKSGEIFDEIFLNEKDELTEGARSNIVLQLGEELYTPPIKCGILNGVLRQNLLKMNKIKEKKLYLKDLKKAKKIFCINSVRGIVKVNWVYDL